VAAAVNALLAGPGPPDNGRRDTGPPNTEPPDRERSGEGHFLQPDYLELARLLLGDTDETARRRGREILQKVYDETAARRQELSLLGRSKGIRTPPGKRWIRVRELLAEEMRRHNDPEGYGRIRQELYEEAYRRSDLIALAKIMEHRHRDYQGAMDLIDRWCRRETWDEELRYRYLRLERREARRRASCTAPPSAPDRNHGS
jgi:hypothetical protein